MDLTPADLAVLDAAYWAVLNRVRLQSGVFTFENHGYQIEWMQSIAQRMCYMKATQGGVSECEVLKSLHGLIHRRFPQGVLYLFPTADDVGEFSKARFNPLIEANINCIKRFVKTGGKGTDTASLKKVGSGFLYLRGTRLTQQIGIGDGEKESTKLRGISVDRVVFDEMDLMDEDVVAKAKGRMGASLVKQEVYISNPTLPDYGIDRVWRVSDQRYLWRKCEACGKWTCAEVSFPKCVKKCGFRGSASGRRPGRP
jgi:phage terminase large subunit GpA-like protein